MATQLNRLNPYNWFSSRSEYEAAREAFMQAQASQNYNGNLYPFTENNPYSSWYDKLRVYYLGETASELAERSRLKITFLNYFIPENVQVKTTTTLSAVGLGVEPLNFGMLSSRMSSLNPTPFHSPNPFKPIAIPMLDYDAMVNNWVLPESLVNPAPSTSTVTEIVDNGFKTVKGAVREGVTYSDAVSNLKGKGVETSNRFELLGVE
jgi:hypothetical protein